MASTSAACSVVKKPSGGGRADSAARRACSWAARMPDRLAATHAAFRPVTESVRNALRDFAFVFMRPSYTSARFRCGKDRTSLPVALAVLAYHKFTRDGNGFR